MNTAALVVMVIAMAAIWGGLILSVIHLIKNPDVEMSKVPSDH